MNTNSEEREEKAEMNEHYYTPNPQSKQRPKIITATLRGRTFTFHTNSGVFSPRAVDTATQLLIEYATMKDTDTVLDLGCGYGPVGISIAATTHATVTLSDVNSRTIALAKENAKENGVNVTVVNSDCFENIPEKFDVILLNPPHSAGRELCTKLITESRQHLTPRGKLAIVAYHNKGGKYYEGILKQLFTRVETLCKKGGIRVYEGRA